MKQTEVKLVYRNPDNIEEWKEMFFNPQYLVLNGRFHVWMEYYRISIHVKPNDELEFDFNSIDNSIYSMRFSRENI